MITLKGLAMIFPGQENPFIIFRSKEIYIYFKTNNKVTLELIPKRNHYQCDHCGKCFAPNQSTLSHMRMRTHTYQRSVSASPEPENICAVFEKKKRKAHNLVVDTDVYL